MRSIARSTLLLLFSLSLLAAQQLKFATVNVWSGLTYHGSTHTGEYETPEHHEARTRLLIDHLRAEGPDVIALQEANPVHAFAGRIADALGYDVISQRVLAGIKVGPLGIPVNLNEGLAILARKDLGLEFSDVWLLSEGFGAIGNGISFHTSEQNIALVGRIRVGATTCLIVNTHWPAEIEDGKAGRRVLADVAREKGWTDKVSAEQVQRMTEAREQRKRVAERLAEHLQTLDPATPTVLLGDFNVTTASQELGVIVRAGYVDVLSGDGDASMTWEPRSNTNCAYSTGSGSTSNPWDELSAAYDVVPRRIDHILLSPSFGVTRPSEVRRILDSPRDSAFASDHFGVMATVDIPSATERTAAAESEFLPIVSYDTDVGFGYGVKAFFLNSLGSQESFDVVLFNSTKGERWYRIVFSMPDFELRQGTVYPWAIDVSLDYDKYLKNSFFGIGDRSRFEDREYYTREPLDLQASVSRGFTPHFVAQAGLRYKMVRNFGFTDTSALRLFPSPSNGRASAISLTASVRYDTRNSFINPSRGVVFQGEGEFAPSIGWTTTSFVRGGAWLQGYTTLFYPKTVLALRVGAQALSGDHIPVQFLLPIGGNQTLRGSPQDRFLDKIALVGNAELRFPIIWRFGGVLGWDIGRVYGSSAVAVPASSTGSEPGGWRSNPVVGLRFMMETFIVRADLGFGQEATGFYLNFGQLF